MEWLYKTDPNVTAQLFDLWHTAFGDDEAYIRLFFDLAYQGSRCFLKKKAGRVVSSLYLLDCVVTADGGSYAGYCLYAAATLPGERRQGYMAALIKEAKAALLQSGRAFIALVPADDGLYDYYARFGFRTAMYVYEGLARVGSPTAPCSDAEYYEARSRLNNAFHWTKPNFDYAMACLRYDGAHPVRTDSGMLLRSEAAVEELLTGGSAGDGDLLPVRSPFPLPGTKQKRFGMIYTENERLRSVLSERRLYMNLALD